MPVSGREPPTEHAQPRPRVIIVMPAFNAAKTLLLTHRDIPKDVVSEIILVDDASTDDTTALAESLGIRVIKHPHNVGRHREATVASIVACITPTFPALGVATRAAVLADVTRFVSSQIQALPDFLRFPYKLAVTAFEWLPLLRWGRPFGALDEERRAACVALWTDAPIGAMRNFVKLIRGCALLAYYDHPALLEALETQAGRTAPVRTAVGSHA